MRFYNKKIKAFSLIEIMVASFLMAMMGVILMTSLNSSITAKDNVENISTNFHLARQAVLRMSKEISMAYLSKNVNNVDPSYLAQFKGYKDRLYFSAFGNVVRQKDAKESDQQVVGYYIGNNKKGEQVLLRAHQANLNLDVEKVSSPQILCPNVKKIEFAYFDNRTQKWEDSWLSDPKSMLTNDRNTTDPKMLVLPAKVKITMVVQISEGNEIVWVSESEIFMNEPLDLN